MATKNVIPLRDKREETTADGISALTSGEQVSAEIIEFPRIKREADSCDIHLERFVASVRNVVIARGGVWDEERSAAKLKRLAEIMASAVPRKS